jgi:diadenosine tetraphosphate (Ap4A) HIT family hydrolase
MTLHPGFPAVVWVVLEQSPGEERRLKYDPARRTFLPTGERSLVFVRGFAGGYGWIAGLGEPPGRHADALIVTGRRVPPGTAVAGRVVGMFCRSDGDHKLVAVDLALDPAPDLFALDPSLRDNIVGVYPNSGPGEGWRGAAEAQAYLRSWTCALCAPDLAPLVAEGQHWRQVLNRNQNVLGKLMVVCRRHVEAVTELTAEEWSSLHHELRRAVRALARAFAPDHLNYLILQNQDRHVHVHVVPRYLGERSFAGERFDDPDFRLGLPVQTPARNVPRDLLDKIAAAIAP